MFINNINSSTDIMLYNILLYYFINANQTMQFHQMNCPYRLEIYLVNLNTKCELQEMQRVTVPSTVQKASTNNWICRLTVTTSQIDFVTGKKAVLPP